MHWWKSAHSPSSSTSPPNSASGSPFSPTKQRSELRDVAVYRSRRHSSSQPRLTRQRKLRHLDLQIDGARGRKPAPSSVSEYSSTVSGSPTDLDYTSNRTSSVSPVPLPLPDLEALLRRDGAFPGANAGGCRLPSPKETAGHGREDFDRTELLKANKERLLPHSPSGSEFVYRLPHRGQEKTGTPSSGSAFRHGTNMLQEAKTREDKTFRLSVPIRSAPSSGLSSPDHSPRRMSISSCFDSSYRTTPNVQFWSVPELLSSDRMASGFSFLTSPETFSDHSPDWSPHPSPNGKNLVWQPRSVSGPPSPLHSKFSSESSPAWHDGLISVHPLPLPPLPSVHLPPAASVLLPPAASVPSPPPASVPSLPPASVPLPPAASVASLPMPSVPVPPLASVPSPPVASVPSPQAASVPSSPAYQTPTKTEVPSMTSQWQKGKLIGIGTFGHVYVATNRQTGALCAMKEVGLIPDDPMSAECMLQLEQEIKLLSHLKHPNIVQYYGSEIIEDRFYIYLEYVHPGSISKYVRDHCGAMTESVVRNFTRHILNGLAYLHSKKTIHRDIKGANLLVDASGVVKLADFGMAKHLNGPASALSLKGSPYWMAPEVMETMMHKGSGYDLAVDIWSLGCTIVEMITGKPPWSDYEGFAAMFKVLNHEYPPIPECLSPEGKDFLYRCFQWNPADRPSACALLEHQFVKSSYTPDIPGYIQEISRMNLMDAEEDPDDQTPAKENHFSDG